MTWGRLEKRRGTEKGQSIVETALVLPVLLLLIVIVVDAARAFDAYIVLTNAAREGARFASLEPSPDESEIVALVVDDVVNSGTNITNMANFAAGNVGLEEGATVMTVTVSYNFPLWFGGLVGLDTFNLRKSAVMPTGEIEEP